MLPHYSGCKITASFLTVRSRHVEGRGDRKTIAQREKEHNPFFVLYDVKQVQAAEVSQRRTAVSSKCFQFYYTCSDRLLAIALPPCSFHIFPLLL
jgi:hypothetical protein